MYFGLILEKLLKTKDINDLIICKLIGFVNTNVF